MIEIHHDFTASVHLPERDTPYPLGDMVRVRLTFGVDDAEQLVIDARVIGAGFRNGAYSAVAHIAADPDIEVLP